MIYLKTYEELNINDPKVGDYVICDDQHYNIDLKDFINSNVGIIKKIHGKEINNKFYVSGYSVEYNNVPDILDSLFSYNSDNIAYRRFSKSEIKYWSQNIKDLEPFIDMKKFNL